MQDCELFCQPIVQSVFASELDRLGKATTLNEHVPARHDLTAQIASLEIAGQKIRYGVAENRKVNRCICPSVQRVRVVKMNVAERCDFFISQRFEAVNVSKSRSPLYID